jgi:hypothetical protein
VPFKTDSTDVSFTPLPDEVNDIPVDYHRPSMEKVAKLLGTDQENRTIPKSSMDTIIKYGLELPGKSPENHLACVDFAYYLVDRPAAYDVREEYRQGYGAWAHVGQFMRYRQEWLDLAESYLREIFSVKENEEIPPVSDLYCCVDLIDVVLMPTVYCPTHPSNW